ncbi:hypothetical protein [Aquitalea sp. ASV11]|uniref:hypothetical protein n=1 Tax=Aquitalea sp. ASV11 TaxID=2795103 RepID=UPI0018EE19B8|nr:hypothetical protein [Aquitalea sp. ASV11]
MSFAEGGGLADSRYDGKEVPTPVMAQRLETPMLSEVTQSYLAYYQKLDKVAMLRKVTAVMPLLVDIIGDKPIGLLKQTDLEAYFEAVQTLPPRWKDICRQEKLRPLELAKQQRGEMSKGTWSVPPSMGNGPYFLTQSTAKSLLLAAACPSSLERCNNQAHG